MKLKSVARMGMIVAPVLLLSAGCVAPDGAVTQSDLDALRQEIAQIRMESKTASDDAAASAAEAKIAAEKAERIYLQSLRK